MVGVLCIVGGACLMAFGGPTGVLLGCSLLRSGIADVQLGLESLRTGNRVDVSQYLSSKSALISQTVTHFLGAMGALSRSSAVAQTMASHLSGQADPQALEKLKAEHQGWASKAENIVQNFKPTDFGAIRGKLEAAGVRRAAELLVRRVFPVPARVRLGLLLGTTAGKSYRSKIIYRRLQRAKLTSGYPTGRPLAELLQHTTMEAELEGLREVLGDRVQHRNVAVGLANTLAAPAAQAGVATRELYSACETLLNAGVVEEDGCSIRDRAAFSSVILPEAVKSYLLRLQPPAARHPELTRIETAAMDALVDDMLAALTTILSNEP